MRVFGIETSCDETAVALVEAGTPPHKGHILAHTLASQVSLHQPYGGVIPEIASRSHLEQLSPLIERCFSDAGLTLQDVDGIAVTAGPGLIGGVMVGVMYAKALAFGLQKPFLAVNHLEGHALTPRLTHAVAFPYLLLLMSGGHTQFLLAHDVGRYQLLGTTIDDALGEAFDKSARLLHFSYPGGPEIERAARTGDPYRFSFPKPLFRQAGCHFSFSGLKTAVARTIDQLTLHQALTPQMCQDVAASLQEAIACILEDRVKNALSMARDLCPALSTLVLAGGVAANQFLFQRLVQACKDVTVVAPPPHLCTDNGVMIAWAGLERLARGLIDPLDFAPRPRWPLSEVSWHA